MSDSKNTRQQGEPRDASAKGEKDAAPGRADADMKSDAAAPADPPDQTRAAGTSTDGDEAPGIGLGAGADVTAVLAAEVETLQAQIADLTNRLLRAHADLDNLRKRAEREKQETARYAITSFAKDTVGLVDNFERAMQAVSPEAAEKDQHLKALLEGLAMTEREFLNVLERHGVKRVAPKGQPFDPRLHQAVMERQDASVANGTVVEVFQAGYTIEERCLRPAMVVVARGGTRSDAKGEAKPDPAEAAASAEPAPANETSAENASGKDAEAADTQAPNSDNDNPSA